MSPDTLPKRVFFCLLVIIIFIAFMTSGCHSVKWEWFPKEDPYRQNDNLKPPFAIKGTKMDTPTPKGVTVIKVSF